MSFTAAELLDLALTPRRQESFRFDLLDSSNSLIGTLAVSRRSPPGIRNDTTASIPRTVSNLRVVPRTALTRDSDLFFAQDVNTVAQRVRVVHVLGPGGPAYELPWGVFLFADDDDERASGGSAKVCQLSDQTQLTAQLLSESVAYPIGTNIATAIAAQAAAAGVISISVEASTATLSAPVLGLAGRDNHDGVLRALAAAAGYLRPYFDNAGTFAARSAPNLATAVADHTYTLDAASRVIAGSIHESTGLLRAPNVYVVRDTSLRDAELVGRFYVPDSAPQSVANIGYERPKSVDVQGLADQANANAAAASLYAQDSSVFASTSFNSPIDSRHDTFGIVDFGGTNFIEQEWAATLRRGGAMGHDIRRIYT